MNRILMRTIVEAVAFLSLSDDTTVDPDAAVGQLEQIASLLRELSQEDQDALTSYIQELANIAITSDGNQERYKFLLSLPEHLGLRN